MKIPILITLLIVSMLFTACAPSVAMPNGEVNTDPTTEACKVSADACGTQIAVQGFDDVTLARTTLLELFEALNAGQYSEAAKLYGGSYEELIDMNPRTDETDHAALLKQACTVNGFQCLKVKRIVQQKQDGSDTFTFTVEFANPDGSLFVLGPCCGSTATDMPPQSTFDFRVMRVPQAGNSFLVQRLPVYTP